MHLQDPIPTTSGVLALLNLQAQIAGQQVRVDAGLCSLEERAGLIELVALRGLILSQIADYHWAEQQAERLLRDFPTEGAAYIARARARGTLHRFAEALADLDEAERLGMPRETVDSERVGIFQALGRYDEARALCDAAIERKRDFNSLGALATLQAELGDTVCAAQTFAETRSHHRGVSPIPLALLDFQEAHMWMVQNDLEQSRLWLENTIRRLPGYAHAQGHLADLEAEIGEFEPAIRRLLPLTDSSDDPDYCYTLDRVLRRAGREEEARQWSERAAIGFDAILRQHSEAFADHAAEFWLDAGDPQRAHALAMQNFEIRPTPRAGRLVARAAKACAYTPSPAASAQFCDIP